MLHKANLVITAAGHGARLGEGPKALAMLDGKCFIDHVLEAFNPGVFSTLIIVRPEHISAFEAWRDKLGPARHITFFSLASESSAESALFGLGRSVETGTPGAPHILAWTDQVGLTTETVDRTLKVLYNADFVVPLVQTKSPYTHFSVTQTPTKVTFNEVLRRRRGDLLPDMGSSDVGLFGLSDRAVESFFDARPETRPQSELDFLDLIPDASVGLVNQVLAASHRDLLAINTPSELSNAEATFSAEAQREYP